MRLLPVVVTGLLFLTCSENKEIGPEKLGYDFYPIQMGQYRIYEVEEIQYNLVFDSLNYQLKETIFDSIVSDDQISYLIHREKRNTANDPWRSDSVWTATMTSNYLAISENNVPFMKLTFPAEVGRLWDGNSLNSKSRTTYSFSEADSLLIDSISFEDHLKVVIADFPKTVTIQDQRIEIYTRGVGLTQKHYLMLQFCSADCPTEIGEIESGRFLNQVLIEAGNE